MDLSVFLHHLNFPADFERRLKNVQLKKDCCSWPVLAPAEDSSVKGIENIFHEPTIISLEEKLGLSFEVEAMINGKVCFANSVEVRPDSRTNFFAGELLNYIFALFPSTEFIGNDKIFIPFPEDTDQFWKLAVLGQDKKIKGSSGPDE